MGNTVNNNSVTNIVNANGLKPDSAEQRAQNKQRQTEIRRLERQEADILKAIETLESEKQHWEAELSRPEVYSNGEQAKAAKLKLDECTAAIKDKTAEWETLAEQLAG